VVSLACTKPKELGLAAELWTISALALYVREHAQAADHPSLSRAGKSTVWRILNAHEIKPHRIRYYLERRDEQFEDKMREVLMVYREIAMDLEANTSEGARPVYTISVDEKPGVQALATSAPDLPPVPGRHAGVGRDHDYVRHGTVSILAGVDLHDGHIIAQVHDRHRSREFVELLKKIDAHYPPDSVIRVVLDNHSAHISKETMRYLATRPGRFVYVHTPKHGSWLNLIEAVFSKMSRTFLRHIRVSSKAELVERIMTGIAEFNQYPVVFRWRNFDKLATET
jgi:transposase